MKHYYRVITAFGAANAITGRQRQFLVSESVTCDPAQPGETVVITVEGILFLVDRAIFEACCEPQSNVG